MKQNWRLARRRLKQTVAGVLFIGLLVGASGTVFTAFAEAITHLGNGPTPRVVGVTQPSSGDAQSSVPNTPFNSAGSGTNSFQPPVVEYPNTGNQVPQPNFTVNSTPPDPGDDGVNSALAAAMDTGGVYVGERVQNVFGSMLKGLLNTLFINTN
ncbi:hypothetical protein [Alicyclobacillus dauci]|uniref:Uncharacterized protein n=1 Tax=Alicyclobacillus dauci TaxID=1475485 RepID=A0ABY6Z8P0_9BACL|nr:hypothetical protein [Alicyclobacillus dauci]WAH38531.1 hypothetical protein NZD86_08640 [Alicyclobacillus dauci]